jgi:uncharacterized protein (TIGR02246 family)
MMNRRNQSFVLSAAAAAALLVVGGCDRGAGAKSDPAAVKNAIKADETKWNDDFKNKNLEALLGHYSDDAFFVAPGVQASGSTAIRKAYSAALPDNYFKVSFASDKIDVADSGDLAYARGHFTEQHQDPTTKKIVSDSGAYITVYRKQSDGSWKAVEDFAAADPSKHKEASAVAKGPKMLSSGF